MSIEFARHDTRISNRCGSDGSASAACALNKQVSGKKRNGQHTTSKSSARSVKTVGLGLLILMLGFVCTLTGCAQHQESAKPQSSDREMSAAFRDQAQRALDALKRLPNIMPSAESKDPGWELRKLDMDKAIDEAKYKAATAKDKQVFDILSASGFFISASKIMHVSDPEWEIVHDASWQCRMELIAELEPDGLPAIELKHAADKTCLKQQGAIMKMWEARHP